MMRFEERFPRWDCLAAGEWKTETLATRHPEVTELAMRSLNDVVGKTWFATQIENEDFTHPLVKSFFNLLRASLDLSCMQPLPVA